MREEGRMREKRMGRGEEEEKEDRSDETRGEEEDLMKIRGIFIIGFKQ